MTARRELVFMVTLLCFVLGASIRELGENLSERAECLGACSLARTERSKTGVKVSSILSCYHCLHRRKGKQWRQERMRGRLPFTANTFTKRHRRSIFLDPSLPTSSTALKPSDCVGRSEDNSIPGVLIPSKVDVAFGQYENTSDWYVNVSWTPLNDSFGQLYGTLLALYLKNAVHCTVLRKNQTFLNINISFYGYTYPEHIYLSIHGLPYRNQDRSMNPYKPSIPTSSTLSKTTVSDNGSLDSSSPSTRSATTSFGTSMPTSSTLSKTTASDNGGLESSSSSTSSARAATSFGTGVSTATKKKSTSDNGGLESSSSSTSSARAATSFGTGTTTFLTSMNIVTKGGPNHTVKYVSIATVSGLLAGLLLVLGFLRCMFLYMRRAKKSVPVPSGFDYHAFIIYSREDSDWVQNKLFPLLEKEHHFKCCIHYRDFLPAVSFCDNMAESVRKSFKIIAVYSKNFLESSYCNYELELAEYRQTTQRDNCLVIIRIDETDCNRLPPGLRGRSVIDYSATVERPFWIGRLLQFLRVPEESDNQGTGTGKRRNTNNRRDSRTGRRIRNTFVRLNSTSSNGSEVSVL